MTNRWENNGNNDRSYFSWAPKSLQMVTAAMKLRVLLLQRKTMALTRQTFVSKVMSLLFNMLSRFVIAFHPRSKRLLISWLQSPSAVIFKPPKIKSVTVSIVSPSISHEMLELDAMMLVF